LISSTPQKILDYGSGDGTFLVMAAPRIKSGWGADIEPGQVRDCQKRLESISHLQFSTIDALSDPIHAGAYDVVTCMETLEHCTAPIVEVVLSDLARLVAPNGRVIISVPIEIGPTFFLKTVIRNHAARNGLSDYKNYEKYPFSEALRMIFATRSTAVPRPAPNSQYGINSHYGFNWKALRERVRAHLKIEKTLFTPLGWLGGYVSSQAWFLCRPHPAKGS
jgi:2-polyprenyl-3-methyl-5-hydroxy-6-metoxy-1,4-benzoquinol methylase